MSDGRWDRVAFATWQRNFHGKRPLWKPGELMLNGLKSSNTIRKWKSICRSLFARGSEANEAPRSNAQTIWMIKIWRRQTRENGKLDLVKMFTERMPLNGICQCFQTVNELSGGRKKYCPLTEREKRSHLLWDVIHEGWVIVIIMHLMFQSWSIWWCMEGYSSALNMHV